MIGCRSVAATFTAGLAAQKHLLRGLFSADGDITAGTIYISSASLGLLQTSEEADAKEAY